MKKKKIICWLLGLCLLLGALGISAARYIERTEEAALAPGETTPIDLQEMLLEEILPDAILMATEILSVIVMLWPTVSSLAEKIGAACAKFGDATAGVLKVSADGDATQGKVQEASNKAEAARAEAARAVEGVDALKQVVALLACGSDSLVANGTARKIMEVLENESNK